MANQYGELEQLIAEGKNAIAEARLLDWLRYHPSDAHAWVLYGRCLSNPAQQRDCFKRALDLDPGNTEARQLLEQLSPARPAVQESKPQEPVSTPVMAPSPQPAAKASRRPVTPRRPLLSESARTRLSRLSYGLFHFLLTIIVAAALILVFYFSVPGLIDIKMPADKIQHNWLAASGSATVSPEIQNAAGIFLNPSRLDYRPTGNYEELKRLQTRITPDSARPDAKVEFSGARFTGQLVGGRVVQSGKDGRPLIVVMDVMFDETRVPVIYYGPADQFKYEDTILVEGVYVAEASAIVAQRVERLTTDSSLQVRKDTLLLLRVAGLVLLWSLLCFSIFSWRLNLRRWENALLSKAAVALLLLPVVLVTSGCTIDLSTTLRVDGTGTTSIMVHESRDNVNFLRSAPGVPGYLSAVVKEIRKSGAMFEQYVEGDQEVFFIQRYFNNSSSETGNSYPIAGSWTYVQHYREGTEEVIRFLGVVDTRTLYDNAGQIDPNVASLLFDQLNQISMRYHLNVPGKVIYSNGDEVTGQQVSWRIQMNGTTYLVAETRLAAENPGVLSSYTLYVYIGLASVFFISTLFLVISIWVRPARRPAGRQA